MKEEVCDEDCKNPTYKKHSCVKQYEWVKKPDCLKDCWYKKESDAMDCEYTRVCENGQHCEKKYREYLQSCLSTLTQEDSQPAQQCANHRFVAVADPNPNPDYNPKSYQVSNSA